MSPLGVVLLSVVAVSETIVVAGIFVGRDRFTRLHYAAATGTLAPLALALAAVIERGVDSVTVRVWLIAISLVVSGPITTHALARAFAHRDRSVAARLDGDT